MSNLIPLDNVSKLPAHLQAFATEGNEFGFSGSSFPAISLKGKVFTIVRGKERTLVTKPGGEGEPAPSLEVVIINVGPKQGYAKTFYAEGFIEGSAAKPNCYSQDGISPAADAQEKQANKCALCPQHAVGSGATNQNPKARACKSSKLLAVAPAGQLNDPMLLRVPGASTMALSEYGDFLSKRGVKAAAVVTRIGFDYSVAHPSLTFKAMGGITAEMAAEVGPQVNSDIVKSIIGEKVVPAFESDEFVEVPALPKKAEPVAAAEEAAPAEAPAPKKRVTKPAPVVKDEGLGDAIDALDFDDK